MTPPSGTDLNDNVVKIGQNTMKNAGYLRGLADTQTQEKNHQPMLMWKTLKREKK